MPGGDFFFQGVAEMFTLIRLVKSNQSYIQGTQAKVAKQFNQTLWK